MNLFYPLSLVFASFMSIQTLVKKNEMIAYLSVGYSFKKLLLPLFFFSTSVTLFFIALQFTKVAYVSDYAKSIQSNSYLSNRTTGLFFKHEESVVYIDNLNILTKEAEGMKIFKIEESKLKVRYEMPKALFQNGSWYCDNTTVTYFHNGIEQKENRNVVVLEGFKPKILDNLEKASSISLSEAFDMLFLLDINANAVKTHILYTILIPFVFVMLIVIFFLNAPLHSRISNVSLFIFSSTFITLLVWGAFLILRKLSINATLTPEIAFIPGFFVILVLVIYYLKKM